MDPSGFEPATITNYAESDAQILQIKKRHDFIRNASIFKWILPDLNQRPSDYESDALTN